MSEFTDKRAAAIRQFYGDAAKRDDFERRYLCHIWYDPNTDSCTAEEPKDDNAACVTKSTQRSALYSERTT